MEDVAYQRLDDFSGAPPSYDEVITDPQPSAPPPGATGPPTANYQRAANPDPPAPGHRAETRTASQATPPTGSSKLSRFVQSYVGYSMPRHLRKHIVPKRNRLDPELDVEAQFARHVVREAQSRIAKSMRVQCLSGWLWCIGVIQVFFYILIPIGMFVTGAVGFSDCTDSNIIAYLFLGGGMVTGLLLLRCVPSLMTCFRNRNYCDSGQSTHFTGCVCMFEVLFYLIALCNLVVLILGTVWIFQDTSVRCSSGQDEDCCQTYVYATSAFFNIFQYVIYTFTSLYICCVAVCIKNMDKVYGSR